MASPGAGQGSTFTVSLPMAGPGAVRAPVAEPEAACGHDRPLRVLVVDDNEDAASLLADLLRAQRHSVLVAYDALHAIEIAAANDIEVFILDIGLPDMDGNALARRLRADPRNKEAVLLALTGYGQANDRVQSQQAGFDHHFVKPIDIAQLSTILAKAGLRAARLV